MEEEIPIVIINQLDANFKAELQGQEQFEQFLIPYEVDYSKILGKKSQGTVYVWKHKTAKNEDITVKIIELPNDQILKEDQNLKIPSKFKFLNNIKQHENYVNILGIYYWKKKDNPYLSQTAIVMKSSKSNLELLLSKGQIKPEDSIQVGYQILKGLKYLKEQSLSHLNIKATNILLGEDGNFKLSDIGYRYFTNKIFNEDNLDLTFVSPELKEFLQRENQQMMDDAEEQKSFFEQGFKNDPSKSDVFSIGLIMLAIQLQQSSPYQQIQNLNNRKNNEGQQNLQNILQQDQNLDQNMSELLTNMLQDNVDQRFDIDQCLNVIESKLVNLNENPIINIAQKNDYLRIQIQCPEGNKRYPQDIVCVLDISGSMSEEAQVKNDQGTKEKYGLSVLDVLKHAVKTIISSLDDDDKFSLITYSDDARLDFALSKMTKQNKELALSKTEQLVDEGTTNIWAGLKMGLDVLLNGQKQDPFRNQSVLLMTDGDPNVFPNAGFIPTLKKYFQTNKNFQPQINTYAIGKKIDSNLLASFANECQGQYSFIPCPGFVGTIFVHSLANILTTYASNCEVSIEGLNKKTVLQFPAGLIQSGSKIQIGDLKFGQNRDIVIKLKQNQKLIFNQLQLNCQVSFFDYKIKKYTTLAFQNQNINQDYDPMINFHIARHLFVSEVQIALTLMSEQKHEDAVKIIKSLEIEIKGLKQEIEDKLNELNIDDENNPVLIQHELALKLTKTILKDVEKEINLGFSQLHSFNHWGVHFAPSISHAHLRQQCNNFADPGVQNYGGKMFNQLKDTIDEIFVKLPPPVSNKYQYIQKQQLQQQQQNNQQNNQQNAYVNQQQRSQSPPPQVDMNIYNNCGGGGCFEGNCTVLLKDGSIKKVKDIQKGDFVKGAYNQINKVVTVVKINCEKEKIQLVKLQGGLLITSKHPIQINGKWVKPYQVASPQIVDCKEVFNFVLESGHTIKINNINCVTFGHGIADKSAQHPYFGTQKIIQDLQKAKNYENGFIEVNMSQFVRNNAQNQVSRIQM